MSEINEVIERINRMKANKSTSLNLNGLDLEQIPDEVFELDFVETLNICNNKLTNIDERIKKLANLKELDLSDNPHLVSIADEISTLNKLGVLSLYSTGLGELPKAICGIKNLFDLNISSTAINNLPDNINNLNLRIFWLYNVPVKDLKLSKEKLQKLEWLGIGNAGIENYDFLKCLNKIQNLQIGNQHFYSFNLVEALDTLTDLSLMSIENADSAYFGKLINLKNIDVSYFKGSVNFISNLINCESIEITNSEIKELPSDLNNLKKLQVLIIDSTDLAHLPASIGALTSLHNLSIYDNKLITLPPEIANLPKLEKLEVSGNEETLISPPKPVVQQGTVAILSYLKDLLHSEPIWASKMVIVGEGGMGKSCLIDSLEGKPFKPGSNTTHGISIRQLQYPHPDQPCQMELNVWDFGGQDIYHATHQFYLTNHSLFVLVWSARTGYDTGKIYKWLEVIIALAPDSPIFIVATNSGPRGADLPKGDIEKQFGSKIHFFEVDNESRTGIPELQQAIISAAATLKYMGVERPVTWIKAKNSIAAIAKKHINKQEMIAVLNEHGVSTDSHESLLHYLHDLGDILYYPEDAILKDTIILKPEWVSRQIAKILDSREVSENAGFLTKELTQSLWEDIDGSMREKLLVLMEKFDLSYKTKDDKEISLVVEKLKFEEPAEYEKRWNEFDGRNSISFKYILDTIPPGIPTWFIARTHRFSTKIHWRYGVVLQNESENNMGLVITSPERKEVWVHVKGAVPNYFFAQLRDTLELTFGRFEGLKVKTMVPCPGHNGAQCSHFFDLKQLEKRLSVANPKNMIECPESLEEVNVFQMLFGISFAPENNMLVEKITQEVKNTIKAELAGQTDELKKFISLEFLKMYMKQQELMDITCPNTFILCEKVLDGLDVDLSHRHYSLQLCCQMPGCCHAAGESYTIKVPREWLQFIGPYYNHMISFLKYTIPMIVPGAKHLIEKAEYDSIGSALETGTEIAKAAPDFKDYTAHGIAEESSPGNMPIRMIRQILDKADPEQKWGGLQRLVSPEGHILWLCQEHYDQYKV